MLGTRARSDVHGRARDRQRRSGPIRRKRANPAVSLLLQMTGHSARGDLPKTVRTGIGSLPGLTVRSLA